MKKFVVALAMVPAVSHAELIVVDPPPKSAPAVPAPQSPALLVQPAVSASPASPGLVDIRTTISPKEGVQPNLDIRPEPPPVPTWIAPAGSTLKDSIDAWAKTAGWRALWRAKIGDKLVNYPITEADVPIHGQIDDAVSQMIHLYDDARFPLKVQISPEQHLFVITLKH